MGKSNFYCMLKRAVAILIMMAGESRDFFRVIARLVGLFIELLYDCLFGYMKMMKIDGQIGELLNGRFIIHW